MSIVIDIAEAIKEELNATTFILPFTAERAYVPQFKLEDMKTLHVTVVPKTIVDDVESRNRQRRDFEIDVAVQQRITAETNDEIDPFMKLVLEIINHFRSTEDTMADAQWLQTRNDPIYAPEHIDQLRQFTSIITFTYRLWTKFGS